MQRAFLFFKSMPAMKADVIPAAKLGGENGEAKNNPRVPPNVVDKTAKYGPNTIPIIGAIIEAKVMAAPDNPTMGKAGIKHRIVYRAEKQIIRAKSFAVSFLFSIMLNHCGLTL